MKSFADIGQYPFDLDAPPPGWAIASIDDVCESVQPGFASGRHNRENSGIPHLRPMNVNRTGHLDLTDLKYVSVAAGDQRLRPGDVLFNNTNSPVLVGKTAVVQVDADLAFSNHMTRLRLRPGMSPRFVAHQLHYLWMSGYFLHRCAKHVNQASIASSTLSDTVPILIAPLLEQDRIANAIDSALSRLDAAVAALERARRNLARYRAAVLHAAVTGRLVTTESEVARAEGRKYEPASELLARILTERRRRWEDAERAKMIAAGKAPKDDRWKARYVAPVAPEVDGLEALPEGWRWATVDQLLSSTQNGVSKRHSDVGIPTTVLRLSDIDDGKIILSEPRQIRLTVHEVEKYVLSSNDLICIRVNGSRELVGRVTRILVGAEPVAYCDHFIRLTPCEPALSPYMALALNCDAARRYLEQNMVSSAGQNTVNQSAMKAMPVPLPPIREQERIVAAVDRFHTIGDTVSYSVVATRAHLSRLRQGILNLAFQGKLVEQDPDDEPADILIERIRVERRLSSPSRRGRDRHREIAIQESLL